VRRGWWCRGLKTRGAFHHGHRPTPMCSCPTNRHVRHHWPIGHDCTFSLERSSNMSSCWPNKPTFVRRLITLDTSSCRWMFGRLGGFSAKRAATQPCAACLFRRLSKETGYHALPQAYSPLRGMKPPIARTCDRSPEPEPSSPHQAISPSAD